MTGKVSPPPQGMVSISSLYDVSRVVNHKASPVGLQIFISTQPISQQPSGVQRRVTQLKQSLPHLPDQEVERIAKVIEAMNCGKRHATYFLKKKSDGPLRSLILTPKHSHVLKKGKIDWDKRGTFKRTTKVRTIPSATKEQIACMAQKVNLTVRHDDKSVDPDATEEGRKDYEYEIKFVSLCKKILSQPLLWFEYESKTSRTRKLTGIEEFLPNTLLPKDIDSLSLKDIKSILLQLVDQLQKIQAQKLLVGDIKEENASWVHDEGKPIHAEWKDFGNGGPIAQQDKVSLFSIGFYGSVDATPPEVLGKIPFEGDSVAVEVWALGYMLLDMVFPPALTWSSTLRNLYSRMEREKVPPSTEEIGALTEEIKKSLLDYEEKTESLSQKNKALAMLALAILKLEPTERPSLEKIKTQILSFPEG